MFGSHLSIAGGMHNALLEAEKLKLGTVQVFTKNQAQWVAKPLADDAIATWRTHADRLGFKRIVAHDSYLINLAAKDDALWNKSIDAFEVEMQRCDQLGIGYLVTHPGAHCGSGETCGIDRVIAALNILLTRQKHGRVTVCLETTAGQGTCLGCTFEHLAAMIAGAKDKQRLAVCLDTCHILAAGYDITTEAGMHKTFDEFDRIIGLDRLAVMHLNDSKKPLGSRVDRHDHIGRGFVGLPAFKVIAQDPRFRDTPKILETAKETAPNGKPWDEINLELLRGLAEGRTMTIKPIVEKKTPTAKTNKAKTRK